jgi:long-chain acyl-CoA synthetase
VSFGASTALNDELPKLLDNLAEVKPTVLIAVPRIFNRIYENVNRQLADRPRFLRKMVATGVRSALKKAQGTPLRLLERIELALDDKLVFSKVRERFGGHLKFVVSGSATLSKEVAELIDALGIPVYEGYGLTETGPIVSANSPGNRRMGSVGKILDGVRVDIDTSATGDEKQGEIVVHGPNVMVGYHNRPDETKAAFTPDGGLHTGDLGHVDGDGFLYITGRIKEQYKLENGKYVMPSPLEEELKLSPYLANIMLFGDGRPFNVALVVVAEEPVRAWAEHQGLKLGPDLTADERVRELIRNEIKTRSAQFMGYEKPREVAFVSEDFTVENGLLTPTLKLKRRDVVERYKERIEELYAKRGIAAA